MSQFEVLQVFPCVYLLFVSHKHIPKCSSKIKLSSSNLVHDLLSWFLRLLWCLAFIKYWNAVAGFYTPCRGYKYQGPPTKSMGVWKKTAECYWWTDDKGLKCIRKYLDHLDGFFFVMLMQWKPSETFPQRSTWGFFLRRPILWIVRITGCRGVEGCHWVSLGVTGCYWVGCELGLSRLDRDLKTGLWVESNTVDHISTFSWEMHNEGSLLVFESWVVGKWVSENQINLLTTTFFRILIWKSHDQAKNNSTNSRAVIKDPGALEFVWTTLLSASKLVIWHTVCFLLSILSLQFFAINS